MTPSTTIITAMMPPLTTVHQVPSFHFLNRCLLLSIGVTVQHLLRTLIALDPTEVLADHEIRGLPQTRADANNQSPKKHDHETAKHIVSRSFPVCKPTLSYLTTT